jgi:hypothetical protein
MTMTSTACLMKNACKQISRSTAPHITKVAGSMRIRALSGSSPNQSPTLLQDQNGFGFARSNPRQGKPRSTGVTEIRGPYYSVWTTLRTARAVTYTGLGDGEAIPGRHLGDVRYILPRERHDRLLIVFCRMGDHVDGLKFAGGLLDEAFINVMKAYDWWPI